MAAYPLYDLLLMLSTDAPEEQRTRALSLVESAISQAGGQIERNDNWGRRPMAYRIRHQPEAEYHMLQFRAPGALVEELSHTLRITDGVLRVRIIKVRRGTPEAKTTPPPVVASAPTSASSTSPTGPAVREGDSSDAEANGSAAQPPEQPSVAALVEEASESASEAPGAPE